MGLKEKHQSPAEEGSKWKIQGVVPSLQAGPLKQTLKTTKSSQGIASVNEGQEDHKLQYSTPKVKEAKKLICPPAPKKPKPPLRCNKDEVQFFCPPDLDSVFTHLKERT